MKQLQVSGHYGVDVGSIDFNVDVYIFKDGNLTYSYCPSLDLMGYGIGRDDAKAEMELQLREYFDYTFRKNTLHADLTNHGWQENGKDIFVAPSLPYLMQRYPDFKDLLENKEYSKYSQPLEIKECYEYAEA